VAILAFCPESPVWLESKDREEADESCIKLWGSYAIVPDVDSTAESLNIPLIDEEEERAQLMKEGWAALSRREYRLMMALALGLPLLQQASGINTVIYFSSEVRSAKGAWPAGDSGCRGPGRGIVSIVGRQPALGPSLATQAIYEQPSAGSAMCSRPLAALTAHNPAPPSPQVFQKAGLESPILGSILMGLVNVGFTLLAASMMDKRGRVPLLQFSYAGMAACLVAVAAAIYAPTSEGVQGLLTAGLIILYVMCFAMGCGPIPWVYLSEILPERIKGTAAALGTFLCWAGNLVVTLTFQRMVAAVGLGGTYLAYAGLNLLALWYVSTLMVETKCRTLDEIEQLLLLPAADAAEPQPEQPPEQRQAPL
jgi:hypothetical protein